MASRYANFVNRFSTTPAGRWLAKTLASRIDPLLYRLSGGRFTSTGPPTIPQLVLVTTGRKTGKRRRTQLGYLADGADFVVAASNFGGANHPAWSYNLLARPDAVVIEGGREVPVRAQCVSPEEKQSLWPRLTEVVPQLDVYVRRTARDIKVFRLKTVDPPRGPLRKP